jgi:NitT/TauT family transport system substrate-binding protein
MPEMTFEWALKQNEIKPRTDLSIDTSIAFAAMSGAFIGGQGDFVTLFEPTALQVEKAGYGYVVASVGEYGGVVPYTAFNAKKSYIENNPKVIEGFTKAIQKGLDYVHSHSSNDIAKVILRDFPDTSLNDLTKIVDRYKNIDSWFTTTYIEQKSFEHIEEIMESAGTLNNRVDFNKLVTNKYSEKN